MRYDIIYADPPWDYKGQFQHAGPKSNTTGSAKSHYQTMKVDDLQRLAVRKIVSDDALLFMWSSSPHLNQAISLMPSWGFDYVTIGFVWDKQRVNPGYYTLSQCEICLIGKKGRIPTPRGARNVRQLVSSVRGEHSAKPEEVRNRIVQMFPTQSKIELFARSRSPGWACWGNEVESDVEIELT